jgi:RNA polymerase sigma-70 factor (ECF subfamily)
MNHDTDFLEEILSLLNEWAASEFPGEDRWARLRAQCAAIRQAETGEVRKGPPKSPFKPAKSLRDPVYKRELFDQIRALAASPATHEECLDCLVGTLGERVFAVCTLVTKSKSEADDASQEIWVNIFNRLDRLASVERIDSYIITAAYNHCRTLLHHAPPRLDSLDSVDDSRLASAKGVPDLDLIKELASWLREIKNDDDREIILGQAEGFTHAQIADELNRDDSLSFGTKVHRMRRDLRERLEAKGILEKRIA